MQTKKIKNNWSLWNMNEKKIIKMGTALLEYINIPWNDDKSIGWFPINKETKIKYSLLLGVTANNKVITETLKNWETSKK